MSQKHLNPEKLTNPGLKPFPQDIPEKKKANFSRRTFLRRLCLGTSVSLLAGGGYAFGIEPVWLEKVPRIMPFPHLPQALHGFRIIQLSDFHFGKVPMDYLDSVIRYVNQQTPDLVVLTGDLVHHGKSDWIKAAALALAGIRARKGVFAILGNHDWLSTAPGRGYKWWADRVANAMADQGLQVLRNETRLISQGSSSLYLVGLDEYWSPNFKPRAAFADVPKNEPCLTLVHNPDAFLEILDQPATWTLAGHTHGGQVNIPFFGPPAVPVKNKKFVAGAYTTAGKHLYINRGIGWIHRVRFNARPEITEFTLTAS